MAKIGPIFFIILPAVYTEFQPASFLVPFIFPEVPSGKPGFPSGNLYPQQTKNQQDPEMRSRAGGNPSQGSQSV